MWICAQVHLGSIPLLLNVSGSFCSPPKILLLPFSETSPAQDPAQVHFGATPLTHESGQSFAPAPLPTKEFASHPRICSLFPPPPPPFFLHRTALDLARTGGACSSLGLTSVRKPSSSCRESGVFSCRGSRFSVTLMIIHLWPHMLKIFAALNCFLEIKVYWNVRYYSAFSQNYMLQMKYS